MAAAVGLAAQASLGTQLLRLTPNSSVARRGRSRCTCSAVAEPPPRLARAAVSSSDHSGSMDSRSAAHGGMFCLWPRYEAMHHASFGRAAQTAPPAQRQVSAAIEALAGVFTDGPVSTESEQEAHVAERWRYQGLRL